MRERASLVWTPAFALARLAFRRAIGRVLLAWCVAIGIFLALREWAPPSAWLGARDASDAASIASGLAREGVWSVVCVAILPLFVLHAARTIGRWRAGEVEWLASRSASRATIVCGTWLGQWTAALCVLAAAAVMAESRAGASRPSFELAGRIGDDRAAWIEGRRAIVWRARDPGNDAPPGARARFELALGAGSAPSVRVILDARRIPRAADARSSAANSDTASSSSEAGSSSIGSSSPGLRSGSFASGAVNDHARVEKLIATRGDIEVDIPRDAGDVEFSIACAEDGERAFLLSERGELWTPVATNRMASAAVFARAAIALGAWLAIAIGLGGWMHASSAALLLAALMIAAWMSAEPSPIWPGGDLVTALAIAERGRVPPPISLQAPLAAMLAAAFGLALARWSIAHWRRAP